MSKASRAAGGRRLPLWATIGFAIVAGLAIGRFASFGADDAAAPTGVAGIGAQARLAGTSAEKVAALEAVVEANPDDGAAWAQLGTLYARRAAETGDPSFYELARRSFDEAEALAPGSPSLLLGRGALLLSLHRFEEAEELGQRAVAELPANAEALGVLVDAQVELGRYDEAAGTLQEMLDVRPGLPALARASYLRQLRGDLEGAQGAMRAAAATSTPSAFDRASVTALLGDLLLASGDPDQALEQYETALRLSPDHIDASLGRARILAARDDLAKAVEAVTAVTDRFPSPTALALLADLQHLDGDSAAEAETTELVRATTQLQEEAGQVVDLELSLFEADVATDPARAVELARSSYGERPDNVFAADALAWALLRSGDAEAALPFAQQAVRLDTIDSLLRYHAAEVFAAVDDDARAASNLKVALRGGRATLLRHADDAEVLAARLGVTQPAER